MNVFENGINFQKNFELTSRPNVEKHFQCKNLSLHIHHNNCVVNSYKTVVETFASISVYVNLFLDLFSLFHIALFVTLCSSSICIVVHDVFEFNLPYTDSCGE